MPYTIRNVSELSSAARHARRLQAVHRSTSRNILTLKMRSKTNDSVVYITIVSAGVGNFREPDNKPLDSAFFKLDSAKKRAHTEAIALHIIENTTLEIHAADGSKTALDPSNYNLEKIFSSNEACKGTANNHEDCGGVIVPKLAKNTLVEFNYTKEYGNQPRTGKAFQKSVSRQLKRRQAFMARRRAREKIKAEPATHMGQRFGKGMSPLSASDLKEMEPMMSDTESETEDNIERNVVIGPEAMNENINRHNKDYISGGKMKAGKKPVMIAQPFEEHLDAQAAMPAEEGSLMYGKSNAYRFKQ